MLSFGPRLNSLIAISIFALSACVPFAASAEGETDNNSDTTNPATSSSPLIEQQSLVATTTVLYESTTTYPGNIYEHIITPHFPRATTTATAPFGTNGEFFFTNTLGTSTLTSVTEFLTWSRSRYFSAAPTELTPILIQFTNGVPGQPICTGTPIDVSDPSTLFPYFSEAPDDVTGYYMTFDHPEDGFYYGTIPITFSHCTIPPTSADPAYLTNGGTFLSITLISTAGGGGGQLGTFHNPSIIPPPGSEGDYRVNVEASVSGVLATSTPPQSGVSNVLFIPGIEASRLYENLPCSGGTCETKVWEPHGDDLATHLLNNPDGQSTESGVYVRTNDIIDNAYVPSVGNVYKSFIEEMNTLQNDGTIREWEAIPYDWRLDPSQIVTKGDQIAPGKISYLFGTSTPYMQQELRRLAATSKTGKVTIIAHSYGGLVTKQLTNVLGAEAGQLIDKIIFVAVPQVGTPQAIGALLHGYDQGLPTSFLPYALSAATARTLAHNMPMTYNLLPSAEYLFYAEKPTITFSDDPLLSDFKSRYPYTYTEGGLHAFITDPARASTTAVGLTYPAIGNAGLYTEAETTHQLLDAWSPPSGVPLYEIAGWGKETLSGIHYYQGVDVECDQVISVMSNCEYIPKIDYTPQMVLDGDGTVVTPSALWTLGAKRYWVNLFDYNGFFRHIGHADILEIPELRNFLREILISTTTQDLPQFIFNSVPTATSSVPRLRFELHSPLSLDVYDEQGNHTGISTTTGQVEENIPQSEYHQLGEVQLIDIPSSTHVHLAMKGRAKGSFTLHIDEANGDSVIASTTFAGVPSATTTRVSLDAPNGGVNKLGSLKVDENADGTPEITLIPALGATITPDLIPPEIKIYFNQVSNTLAFIGLDNMGSTSVSSSTVYPALKKGQAEYRGTSTTTVVARDAAGNITKLLYTELLPSPPQRDTVTPFALVYNNATTTVAGSVSYKWRISGSLYRLLASYMRNATTSLESHYRPNKSKTIIMTKPVELTDADTDDDSDMRPIRQTLSGIVLPFMVTQRGSLLINY